MTFPKWTVLYNIDCGNFIGTAWEFYIEESIAQKRYEELRKDSKYCATKRPYHHNTDFRHLGAVHR